MKIVGTKPEYIERNTVLSFLYKCQVENFDGWTPDGQYMRPYEDIVEGIEKLPAADVEPVRHGRWQNKKSPWSQGGYMMDCSYCHEIIASLSGKLKFCPNCGARMDLGTDGHE